MTTKRGKQPSKAGSATTKRAAIYVRVSSEGQAHGKNDAGQDEAKTSPGDCI